MIKIMLVVGGVWFSLAFVFIGALFAARSRPVPKIDTQPTPKPQPIPRTSAAPVSDETEPAIASLPWELGKPVEA